MWKVIDTGIASAQRNMQLDEELLESLAWTTQPILHFYGWEKQSATYGHFVDPAKYLNLEEARRRGLALAKRPTGGGIVFHEWDLAFSVLVPASCSLFSLNTLDNYALVNKAVLQAVKEFLSPVETLQLIPVDAQAWDLHCDRFCMAKPTKYDVVLEGKKVAGAAQRRRKEGFLHQGTIALMIPPEEFLREILLPNTRVLEAMQIHTSALLGRGAGSVELKEARLTLQMLLRKYLI